MVSPAAALPEADCSAEVATVMVHPEAPVELLKPLAQVTQSELLSWSAANVAAPTLDFPEGQSVQSSRAS